MALRLRRAAGGPLLIQQVSGGHGRFAFLTTLGDTEAAGAEKRLWAVWPEEFVCVLDVCLIKGWGYRSFPVIFIPYVWSRFGTIDLDSERGLTGGYRKLPNSLQFLN